MTRDAMLELAAILTAAGDSIRALCEPSLLVTAPPPEPSWPPTNIQEQVDTLRLRSVAPKPNQRLAREHDRKHDDAIRQAIEDGAAIRPMQGIRPSHGGYPDPPTRLHVVRDTPDPGPNAATPREYSPVADHHCPRDGEPYCCSDSDDVEPRRRSCLSLCAEDDHAPVLSPDWSHPSWVNR